MVSRVIAQYKNAAMQYKRFILPPLILAAPARILVDYIPPLFIAHILNSITQGQNATVSELLPWILGFLAAAWFGELLWRIIIFMMNRGDSKVIAYLANKSFKRLIEREYAFFTNNFAGSLVAKTNRFTSGFEVVYDTLVFEIIGVGVAVIFALVILGNLYWQISLLFVAVLIIYFAIIIHLTKKRLVMTKERAKLESLQTAQLADSLTNAQTIKSFAKEQYERKLFSNVTEKLRKKRVQAWDYQNMPIDFVTTNMIILLNGAAVLGAVFAYNYSNIPAGSIYLIITYTMLLTNRFWNVGRIIRNLENSLGNASEMAELLEEPIKIIDRVKTSNDLEIPKNSKPIEFKNVVFCYEDDTRKLFDRLSFVVNKGEKVGVVGTSGGGKTSLTKLILRFHDIDDGQILINGLPVNKITQKQLRSLISYVPQDPALFHRSIKENIAYAKPSASKREIESVAVKSHSNKFIQKLPNGYETMVGERGVKLSGGQRQRIAIARAMLKDSDILILDEATSALDSHSESLIQDALWKLMKDKTAIVIAHRLSTVQKMDRIIVLDQGKIVEDGPHEELLQNNSVYAKLWKHQTGGFLK
jgi:ATP-binding cassette subfamily B protein